MSPEDFFDEDSGTTPVSSSLRDSHAHHVSFYARMIPIRA
jgi:hypothetical protein